MMGELFELFFGVLLDPVGGLLIVSAEGFVIRELRNTKNLAPISREEKRP